MLPCSMLGGSDDETTLAPASEPRCGRVQLSWHPTDPHLDQHQRRLRTVCLPGQRQQHAVHLLEMRLQQKQQIQRDAGNLLAWVIKTSAGYEPPNS